MAYSNSIRQEVCESIVVAECSIAETSKKFNIPETTIRDWLSKFKKDPYCFSRDYFEKQWFENKQLYNSGEYLEMDQKDLLKELMKKDIEIARLKKGYCVKGVGAKKEFVTSFKRNMK